MSESIDQLLEKYAAGTASQEEEQRLVAWYRSFEIGEVEWPASMPDEKEQLKNRMERRLHEAIQAGTPGKLRSLAWLRIAAILLVFLGVGGLTMFYLDTSVTYETVRNPSGSIRRITLPDSSVVWLNAASELQYASDFRKNRKIRLNGEGYFVVLSDIQHPFTVEAGGLKTTVLGTSFNIKSYKEDDQATFTVLTGKVKVEDSSHTLAELMPSMQLQMNRVTQKTTLLRTDSLQVTAWQKGKLSFAGQNLDEITATLGRWYGVQFVFSRKDMYRCRYYLNFESSISLENLMLLLKDVTQIEYSIDNNKHTVSLSGRACNSN